MADKIEIKVSERTVHGKKVRFLRNKGVVPVHLFGHNMDSQSLQGNAADLGKVISQAGRTRLINLTIGDSATPRPVLVREIQKDPIRGNLIHVDFYAVNMAETIKVEVPIAIVGESPALKVRENMLYQTLDTLLVECLPDKMPDRVQVDISSITEVDQAIHVKDVQIPDVEILNDPDLPIVKVGLRPVEEVAERPAEEAAAGAAEGAPAAGTAAAESQAETAKSEKK
jgi:large subunit ribosomal protein L25